MSATIAQSSPAQVHLGLGLDDRRWFVMRAYKTENRAEDALVAAQLPCFVPKRYALRTYHGHKQRKLIPVLPSLLFVSATRRQLLDFKAANNYVQFIMLSEGGNKRYMTVPDEQMKQFIAVAGHYDDDIRFYHPDELKVKPGDCIRVIGGAFDGVEGRFIKMRGCRKPRVMVQLEGLLSVTSAEIEPDFIQPINN